MVQVFPRMNLRGLSRDRARALCCAGGVAVACASACVGSGDPAPDDYGVYEGADAGTADDEESTGVCGWGRLKDETSAYVCGGRGADPSNDDTAFPFDCPGSAIEGEPCDAHDLDVEGCCTGQGDVLYCDGDGLVAKDRCGDDADSDDDEGREPPAALGNHP